VHIVILHGHWMALRFIELEKEGKE